MQNLAITWLGHSSYRLRTPGGKEVLVDPWYTGNPAFPASARPKAAVLPGDGAGFPPVDHLP